MINTSRVKRRITMLNYLNWVISADFIIEDLYAYGDDFILNDNIELLPVNG